MTEPRAPRWLLRLVGSGMGGMLFAGRIGGAAALFIANLVLARALGAAEFGRYSLTVSLLLFGSLFFDFGYFSSGAHLLTKEEDRGLRARRLVSAMAAVAIGSSVLFAAGVLGFSYVADRLFPDRIGAILAAAAPVAPAMIMPLVTEQALKGLGRTGLLAVSLVAPRVLFVLVLAGMAVAGRLTARTATLAYLTTGLIVGLATLAAAGARPRGWSPALRELWAERARFGRALYGGRLANVISHRTDVPLIGHFWGATAVGQYNLAMSVAGLIAMFSTSLVASAFRGLAIVTRIPRALLRQNLVGVAAVGAGALLAGYALVAWYLGPTFSTAARLLLPCVVAVGLQGAYQPYNSWLLANGYGVELGRFLFVTAGTNLLANVILIPWAGVWGAAGAGIISMGTYLVLARKTYRHLIRLQPTEAT